MVRPLYPPRKKAPPPPPPLWKNPQLVGAAAIILILVVIFVHHFFSSGLIDPEALPAGKTNSTGLFSFLKPSKYFKSDAEIAEEQKQKLSEMGIKDSKALSHKVEAKDLREQRRILAMRKYEATRENSTKRQEAKKELRKRLSSPTSLQLKDAVMALEESDNLGIMKLERLLEEKLMSHGANREDLDVIVFAYDSLAKVYEKKSMHDKAKEAYINAFKLMKKKAPDEQGPDWDDAIGNVEQMRTTTSRSN